MSRIYVFADESGDMTFSRQDGASRYFILGTIAAGSCAVGEQLLQLRRDLVWEGAELDDQFHASKDSDKVRDRVFNIIEAAEIRVDLTLLYKPKTYPPVRSEDARFYRTAWYLHLRHLAPRIAGPRDELYVTGASMGTRRKRNALASALAKVVSKVSPTVNWRAACWPAHTDPCLQVVDYCCWAVQRKWERGEERYYSRIRKQIATEYDIFQKSPTEYY